MHTSKHSRLMMLCSCGINTHSQHSEGSFTSTLHTYDSHYKPLEGKSPPPPKKEGIFRLSQKSQLLVKVTHLVFY